MTTEPREHTLDSVLEKILDKRPKGKHLTRLLKNLEDRWKEFGQGLYISQDKLTAINSNSNYSNSNRLDKVIQIWITERPIDLTWRALLHVLKNYPVNDENLVADVKSFLLRHDIQYFYKEIPVEVTTPLIGAQPTEDILRQKPRLTHLKKLKPSLADRWLQIGKALVVSHFDLEALKNNQAYNDGDRLMEVFKLWLDDRNTVVSWKNLMTKIADPKLNKWLQGFLTCRDVSNFYLQPEQELIEESIVLKEAKKELQPTTTIPDTELDSTDDWKILAKKPSKSHLRKLKLNSISKEWKDIGRELGVDERGIQEIENNENYNDSQKLSNVIILWADRGRSTSTAEVTWGKILQVLSAKDKSLGEYVKSFLSRHDIKYFYIDSSDFPKSPLMPLKPFEPQDGNSIATPQNTHPLSRGLNVIESSDNTLSKPIKPESTPPSKPESTPPSKPSKPESPPPSKPSKPESTPPSKPSKPESTPPSKPSKPESTPPSKPELTPPSKPSKPELTPPSKPSKPESTPPSKPSKPELTPPSKPSKPESPPPSKPSKPESPPPSKPSKPESPPPSKPESTPPSKPSKPESSPPSKPESPPPSKPESTPPSKPSKPESSPPSKPESTSPHKPARSYSIPATTKSVSSTFARKLVHIKSEGDIPDVDVLLPTIDNVVYALKEGYVRIKIAQVLVQGSADLTKSPSVFKALSLNDESQESIYGSGSELTLDRFAFDIEDKKWSMITNQCMQDMILTEIVCLSLEHQIDLRNSKDKVLDNGSLSPQQSFDQVDNNKTDPSPLQKKFTFNESFDEKQPDFVAMARKKFDKLLGDSQTSLNSENLKRLALYDHWMCIIDCGGQIQFQKLIQSILPCPSVMILAVSLAEDFCSQSFVGSMTIEELITQFVAMINLTAQKRQNCIIRSDPCLENMCKNLPKCMNVMAIGTHHSKKTTNPPHKETPNDVNERINSIETKLSKIFRRINDIAIYQEDYSYIHQVDFHDQDPDIINKEVTESIDNVISDQSYEVDMPISWYYFHTLLYDITLDKCGMLSLKTCVQIGKMVGLADEVEVVSALKFFHIFSLMLYFPDSPADDIVFVQPERTLCRIISELVGIITKNRQKGEIPFPIKSLVEIGNISLKSFTRESKTCKEICRSFEQSFDDKLLKLFEHLKIATKLPPSSGDNEYIIPGLLPICSTLNVDPFPGSIPLLFFFKQGSPLGFFSSVIMHLISSTQPQSHLHQWEIARTSWNYSNKFNLTHHKMIGKFVFVEKLHWFEVYSEKIENQSTVLEMVEIAVNTIAQRYNIPPPVKAFYCPCGDDPVHAAIVDNTKNKCTLCCTSRYENFHKEDSLCQLWFKSPPKELSEMLSQTPDHVELLDQLAEISHKWQLIGNALGIQQNVIQGLKTNENDDKMRLDGVLQAWRERNDSVTWKKIIEVLEGDIVAMNSHADKLKEYLKNKQ